MDAPREIAGVAVIPLKKVVNDRGHLQEIVRNDDPRFTVAAQVYLTATKPGVVKAWYRHWIQTDQIAIAAGQVRVALFDTRENSPSQGVLQELVMIDSAPTLLQIPPGVWHGFQGAGAEPALLLHLNSEAFNEHQLDEDRLPPTTLEIPFKWAA